MTTQERTVERNRKQGRENFVKGMAFEFKVLAKEKKKSLFAIRSAGSHSLVDIVSTRKNETRLLSIRKNGTWITKEIEALVQLQEDVQEGHTVYLVYQEGSKIKYDSILEA